MKRIAIIVIVVGMFAWAVYDFVLSDNQEQTADETIEQSEENETETSEVEEAKDKSAPTKSKDVEVGLERGQLAPDFELPTLDGDTVRLSDFYGKPIMLNFWASWCAPCRAEIPDMQRFYEDKDVEIVAVNLTTSEHSQDAILEFVEEFGMTFPVLLDEKGSAQTIYEIQPIPTTFLLNSKGYVHNIAYGPLNYDLMVQAFEEMQ